MDAVASTFTDLILSNADLPRLVNLTHPRRVAWRNVFANVNSQLTPHLPLVHLVEWVKKLEELSEHAGPGDLERVVSRRYLIYFCLTYSTAQPAIKLLSFFRGLSLNRATSDALEAGGVSVFDTTQLQAFSPTMRGLPPLGEGHAKSWINYWKGRDFLHDL